MISLTSAIVLAIGLITVAWIAVRDHGQLRASRRRLLDRCVALLDGGEVSYGGDDFPALKGRSKGVGIHAALIPDTMTIRRLPQLWLSLTRFEARPGTAGFAVLVRPAGTEFYSLTSQFDHRLAPPAGFPDEVLARGDGPGAQALLDKAGPLLAKILRDPKVKEVGVTAKGLRLVWQAGEGRRGEHLLLRQAHFDGDGIESSEFAALLQALEALSHVVRDRPESLPS